MLYTQKVLRKRGPKQKLDKLHLYLGHHKESGNLGLGGYYMGRVRRFVVVIVLGPDRGLAAAQEVEDEARGWSRDFHSFGSTYTFSVAMSPCLFARPASPLRVD